jgi:hypothetical protein
MILLAVADAEIEFSVVWLPSPYRIRVFPANELGAIAAL